ncbi:Hypothetical predicted protein [Cloeon dipterum]|uniref:DM domain-containing protein n=1 Tax=Cloeon dipterum TaxID=197152 RepID=A0A8S1DUW1_9INSE|nr:Hypothetical predicted protein [Cloeon dipterum]
MRAPTSCARCRNHSIYEPSRGQTRYCVYLECMCFKCKITAERQRGMALRCGSNPLVVTAWQCSKFSCANVPQDSCALSQSEFGAIFARVSELKLTPVQGARDMVPALGFADRGELRPTSIPSQDRSAHLTGGSLFMEGARGLVEDVRRRATPRTVRSSASVRSGCRVSAQQSRRGVLGQQHQGDFGKKGNSLEISVQFFF